MPDSPAAQDPFRRAKAFFNNGEFFRSYDLALEGMAADGGADERFAHLAVLSLANAGAPELALERYTAFGLDQRTDTEARTLLARLKKDEGFAQAGEQRQRLLAESASLYETCYQAAREAGQHGAYYPGINAAALALWTGQTARAEALAGEVLEQLSTEEPGSMPEDLYWILATRLEALLILGRLPEAEALAADVVAAGKGQFAQLSSTGRQLRRLSSALNLAPAFLQRFTPCSILTYTGHIIARPGAEGRFNADEEHTVRAQIDALLERESVGSGYGSLAAGADILFAEALLARGARLHVFLPFAVDDFLEQSVRPAGAAWEARFQTCLAAAESLHYATEDAFLGDDTLFAYCGELAMGLAVLAARHLQAPVLQAAVWDGDTITGPAGTYADMQTWRATGLPQHTIAYRDGAPRAVPQKPPTPPVPRIGREIRTMLFGDVHGFSKLTDRDLPIFAQSIMGSIGEVTRTYQPDPSFVNTWGDGVFIVFADPGRAARWALDVQGSMRRISLADLGLPLTLQLRLGGHMGPAYELPDPIMLRPNYYGAHVSRAARIEPITPEGCVYVTETFAAVLALRYSGQFACDYVGYTEMAKHYGQLRIFLLRAATETAGPAVLGDIERAPLRG